MTFRRGHHMRRGAAIIAVVSATYLVDESGNFLVDESGNNLVV